MPRWVKITGIVLAILLIVGGGAYYWYIGDGDPAPTVEPSAFNLEAIRTKADELPGGKAIEVRVEKIADFAFPAVASVGGDGWNILPMAAYAFQIVLPADTIIIDAGLTAQAAASLSATVEPDAASRLDMAMEASTQIVVTHEHPDHIGRIVGHAEPDEIRKALRLTRQQVESLKFYDLSMPAALADYVPIDYEGMLTIAPGVVLVRAAGHTPGSQLVYVKCEDGREFLFVGDVAWTLRNVETGKGRPRLMSAFLPRDDRDEVFRQLAALRAMMATHKDLRIVPGHDVQAIDALIDANAMTAGFAL